MAWLELTLALRADATADVEQCLENAGALSITLTDAADQPLLEPGVGETPLWDKVTLSALFAHDVQQAGVTDALVALDATNQDTFHWREVKDQAWERVWLDRFSPQQFGDRLWVVPGEHTAPDDAVVVRLDPGLAFGTGDHETTAMCLEWLGGVDSLAGQHVLDFGCGSGILAIAAAQLGASRVVALDNDPQALIATRDNAARNGVVDRIEVVPAPLDANNQFDIVLANVLAGPLIALADRLVGALRNDGQLVLSGLLTSQTEEVGAAYTPHVVWEPPVSRGDWARLDGRRVA
ncbi:MAG: 50S ribosomal protein L11 methyltransferase [Pseudomonadota bacterium]